MCDFKENRNAVRAKQRNIEPTRTLIAAVGARLDRPSCRKNPLGANSNAVSKMPKSLSVLSMTIALMELGLNNTRLSTLGAINSVKKSKDSLGV